MFWQRSPRYRMTPDGAKKYRRLLIYDIFSYNRLDCPQLSRVLFVFMVHNAKTAIYRQKLHTKKARTKRIFFVNAKKLVKTKQIKRICFRFLLRNLIMTLIIYTPF